MLTRMTFAMLVGAVVGATVVGGAERDVFDFHAEIKDVDRGRPAVNRYLVRASEYTVSAVAVNREIKTHRHETDSHVLYVVSGRGTAVLGDKAVALRPGMVLHIPKGVTHSVKADGEQLALLDFTQHPAAGEAEKK